MTTWQPIETLEPGVVALVWRPYETDGKQFAVDSFRWREQIVEELQSETRNASGRRKVIQERIERSREWDGNGWGTTHWMPLPDAPSQS